MIPTPYGATAPTVATRLSDIPLIAVVTPVSATPAAKT